MDMKKMKTRKKQMLIITTIIFLFLQQNVKAASNSSLAFSEGTQLVWRVNKTTTTNGTDVEEKTFYQRLNISKIVEDSTTVNVTFNSLESNETVTESTINAANWTESHFGLTTGNQTNIFDRSVDGGDIFPFFCLLDSNLSKIQTFNETTTLNFLSEIAMKLSIEYLITLFVMAFSTISSDISELTNSSQILTCTDTKLVGSYAYNSTAFFSGTNAWTNMTLETTVDLNYDPVSRVLISGNINTATNMTMWNNTLMKYVSTDMTYLSEFQLIAPMNLDTSDSTTTTSTTTTSPDETSTSTSTNSTIETSHGEEGGIQGLLDSIPGFTAYYLIGFSILGIIILIKIRKYQ